MPRIKKLVTDKSADLDIEIIPEHEHQPKIAEGGGGVIVCSVCDKQLN